MARLFPIWWLCIRRSMIPAFMAQSRDGQIPNQGSQRPQHRKDEGDKLPVQHPTTVMTKDDSPNQKP